MAGLVPLGFLTFLDSNGDPLVGGTVAYYDPASSGTLKPIWADPQQLVPVNNPAPLDAAGRPTSGGSEVGIWGTGDYQMMVRDANGVLQWSALTTTPLATADLNALESQLTAETNARIAADAAEANARASADNAEASARAAADTTLQNNINSEAATRAAEDTNLQNQINALVPGGGPATPPMIIGGRAETDPLGHVRITFSTPFTTLISFVATGVDNQPFPMSLVVTPDATGADVYVINNQSITGFPSPFYWIAIGR